MRMKILLVAAAAFAGISAAHAAEGDIVLPQEQWSWEGPFGSYDQAQLQRGLQVYTQVCSNCHSLHFVAYRDLRALGYSADAVKAYAANYQVQDGPNDQGEMFMRAARPSDHFVSPFPNDNAARAANNGALPPDLSLMVKARKDGANHVYGILTGFKDAPAGFKLMDGMNYNEYFAGHQIAMPQPLYGDDVEYADGTKSTLDQEAKDVTAFLAWAAEPKLEARKSLGIQVLFFLGVLFVFVVAVKRSVWRDVKH